MHVQQKRNITFSLKGNDNYTIDVKIFNHAFKGDDG